MIEAFILMGGLGIVIGIGLAVASKVFYVYVDPKILAVDDALPGANCGGCGLPGCLSNAEAIVAGKAAPNSCVVGPPDLGDIIAGIIGATVEAREPDIALPGCAYGLADSDLKYLYSGAGDCRAAALLGGGMKVCNIGCLGLGTCAAVCQFDAIKMSDEDLPVVDEVRCTGCGACERACPKKIITLSSVTRRIIKELTTEHCTTPCQRKCPAGIEIRDYIHQISVGNYHGAVQVIKERNPFPTVIGRICPRPCETECRRIYVDEPVSINALKRFCADFEKVNGERILPFKAPETDRSIAVIGGGIEGLSTAFFLARLGHKPTVFEATSELGGLLRTAIVRERLPMEILDWDIEGVREMGVRTETGKVFGKDLTLNGLLAGGFETVFLASGGWDSRLVRGAGSDIESPIPGTMLLIDLFRLKSDGGDQIALGPDVVIAGGGSHSVKAIETCRALGAKTITVLFQDTADAVKADVDGMEQAGAAVIFGAGITRIEGEEDRLTGVEYQDEAGRTDKRIPAQNLILSSGRFPEMAFARPRIEDADENGTEESAEGAGEGAPADDRRDWEGVLPYKQPGYGDRVGLLAEGDPLTDMSAAIGAISAGRRGAASIHAYMYGLDITLPDHAVTSDSDVQNVDRVYNVNSSVGQIMPVREELDSVADKETELGFTEEMARTEADRCLQCGLICYQRESAQTITLAPLQDMEIPASDQERLPEPVGQPEIKSVTELGRIQ